MKIVQKFKSKLSKWIMKRQVKKVMNELDEEEHENTMHQYRRAMDEIEDEN